MHWLLSKSLKCHPVAKWLKVIRWINRVLIGKGVQEGNRPLKPKKECLFSENGAYAVTSRSHTQVYIYTHTATARSTSQLKGIQQQTLQWLFSPPHTVRPKLNHASHQDSAVETNPGCSFSPARLLCSPRWLWQLGKHQHCCGKWSTCLLDWRKRWDKQ